MSDYKPEQRVRLVPSQGGHQKERKGQVVRVTATQVLVRPDGAVSDVRFRIVDGMPINKIDQQFPCYYVAPE